jgi:hypothetical protein
MKAMLRSVEPEWLDRLEASDARAKRARRDLRLVNALMRNAAFIARALEGSITEGARLADLGAGDGTLMLAVAQKLRPRPAGASLALVDRAGAVSEATIARFAALGWRASVHAVDASGWLRASRVCHDAIIANLFLHHFSPEPLGDLLALVAERTRLFVACEPRRSLLALGASRALLLLGCGPETRHDAPTSVKAGFAGRELSRAWPGALPWTLEERRAGAYSHLFIARRRTNA